MVIEFVNGIIVSLTSNDPKSKEGSTSIFGANIVVRVPKTRKINDRQRFGFSLRVIFSFCRKEGRRGRWRVLVFRLNTTKIRSVRILTQEKTQ